MEFQLFPPSNDQKKKKEKSKDTVKVKPVVLEQGGDKGDKDLDLLGELAGGIEYSCGEESDLPNMKIRDTMSEMSTDSNKDLGPWSWLGPTIWDKDMKIFDPTIFDKYEYLLIYWAHGSWCACKVDIERLIEIYKKINANGKKFEVIQVGNDDQEGWDACMMGQEWYSLPINDEAEIEDKIKCTGYPTQGLVRRDGKVIFDDMLKNYELNWMETLANFLADKWVKDWFSNREAFA